MLNKNTNFFIVTVLMLMLGNQAHAQYDWKNYFSFGSIKAIEKQANITALNSLKKDSDWKEAVLKITDKAYMKNGSIASGILPAPLTVTNNNVGIGSANPSQKLTVGGNIQLSGYPSGLYLGNAQGIFDNGTSGLSINVPNTNSALNFTTNGGNITFNGGNVGIGNTSPASKLDVSGNAAISGSVTAASIATSAGISAQGAISTALGITASGDISAANITASGNVSATNVAASGNVTAATVSAPNLHTTTITFNDSTTQATAAATGSPTSGVTKLANGLILQWGEIDAAVTGGGLPGTNYSFNIPFPNAALSLTVSAETSAQQAGDKKADSGAFIVDRTQFTLQTQYENTNPPKFYWMAIGY